MAPAYKLPDIALRYNSTDNNFTLTSVYVTPEVQVPAGETTDGASVPFWARWAFPRYDKYLPACVVHDYMYGTGLVSRKKADFLFKKNLKRCGLHTVQWWLMFWAVRIGGASHYTKKRTERATLVTQGEATPVSELPDQAIPVVPESN
jgi:hypothetical protein